MKRSFFIALIVFLCFSQVCADSTAGKASIEVNLASRILSLYKDGVLLKEYPVCVGKQSTPTPRGEYRVVYKTVNPYWMNKEVVVPPGPQNPLGIRWIGITKSLGIHGNNKPESIGTYASSGCIRMYNRDVEELYTMVPVNTPVLIKYDRVKVIEDKYSGEKAAVIYPDSYRTDKGDSAKQAENLRNLGIPEELIHKIQAALKMNGSKPKAVCQGIGVFLNDSFVTCDALEEQGEIYADYKAAEEILGLTPEQAGLYDIGIKEQEGDIYINLSQTAKSFGGSVTYDKDSRNVYISMKIIKINGAFAGINYGNYDKSDYIAVEAAKQLEYECSEDSVDLRIFDKGIMKTKQKNGWSVNADSVVKALEGGKIVNSQYRIVDVKLPTFLRIDGEYFKTVNIDGRLALSTETAYEIHGKTAGAIETFSVQEYEGMKNIDLETFLENYEYVSNNFGTVIDIKARKE